jgi:hypothetical protein
LYVQDVMLTTREVAIVVGKSAVPDVWLFGYAANKPNPVQVWTKTVHRRGPPSPKNPAEPGHVGMLRIIESAGRADEEYYLLIVAEHSSGSTDLPDEVGAYLGQFLNGNRRWLVFLPARSKVGAACSLPVFRERHAEALGPL